MKTLILYGSRKGCTKKCAFTLRDEINRAGGAGCDVVDIKKARRTEVSRYDHVIIGSSIWAGKVHPGIRRFIDAHRAVLPAKRMGFFLCSGREDAAYFENNFPRDMITRAEQRRFFGGELSIEDYGPLMRYLLKRKAGVTGSYRRINGEEIRTFARQWVTGGGR